MGYSAASATAIRLKTPPPLKDIGNHRRAKGNPKRAFWLRQRRLIDEGYHIRVADRHLFITLSRSSNWKEQKPASRRV